MSAAWERYLPSLNTLLPGMFDVEIRERAGLMLLRDEARKSRVGCNWVAHDALMTVQSIADELALRPVSLAQLVATRKALIRITMAARDLEIAFGEQVDG